MHGKWPVGGRVVALTALTAALPGAEMVVLLASGVPSIAGIAPQVTAPTPFGGYHDLRWVFVFHRSWAGFGAELIAALLWRTALNTALTVLAWPTGRPHPGIRRLLVANAVGALLVMVLFSPWVTLAGMSAATGLAWFLFGSLLAVFLLSLVMNRGGIAPGWWRHPPSASTLGLGALTFLLLSAYSTVISATPGWWALPVACVCGALNAPLWRLLVSTALDEPKLALRAFVTPIAIALVPALFLGVFTRFISLTPGPPAAPPNRVKAGHLGPVDSRPVLFVHGYGSNYSGEPMTGYPDSLSIRLFSYRGQYPNGDPLPYGPKATHQPLGVLAHRLGQQVETMHRLSGKQVAILATSEGTLVTRTYLEEHPDAPVDTFVALSPLVSPARVYYPPQGADSGWGIGLGWEIRMLTTLSRLQTGSATSADEPFVRSLLHQAPRYRATMLRPIRGVHVMAFLPTSSAAAAPPVPGPLTKVPVQQIEALHGALQARDSIHTSVVAALSGHRLPSQKLTTYGLLQDAAAGWQVPTLPVSFVPSWQDG